MRNAAEETGKIRRYSTEIIKTGIIFSLLILLLGCGKSAEGKSTESKNPAPPEGFSEFKADGIIFQWKITGEDIEVILAAPTEGWVAVGFNPTEMMQDANFIIGYVEDGKIMVRDDYGSWLTSHASDEAEGGTSDVTIIEGKEDNGWTILHFLVPLNSGDSFDRVIRPGETTKLLLAFGRKDDFTTIHRKKTKTEIVF